MNTNPLKTRETRAPLDQVYMGMAYLVAQRSTCCRRNVGCVLVDAKNRVLATGHNGVASGVPHCNSYVLMTSGAKNYPYACVGAGAPSGQSLDACGAIHSEQNALLQCRDVDLVRTCYVTTCPCVPCMKLLLGTGCRRLVYAEPYPGGEVALTLWANSGRVAELQPLPQRLGGALAEPSRTYARS